MTVARTAFTLMLSLLLTPLQADTTVWTAGAALNNNAAIDPSDDLTPEIATDGVGTWISIWHTFNDSGVTRTAPHIVFARSTDGGATWSNPTAMISNDSQDDAASDYQPKIATNGLGTWVATWMSYSIHGASTESDIVFSRSLDNGLTWSAPQSVHDNSDSDTGTDETPRIATDRNGVWVITWSTNNLEAGGTGTDKDIWYSRSTSNGLSWTDGAPLNPDFSGDNRDDINGELACDGDGYWIMVWNRMATPQSSSDDADIVYCRSVDNGLSWSSVATANGATDANGKPDLSPTVATDGLGRWVIAWATSDPIDSTDTGDWDIVHRRSNNYGESFGDQVPLNSNYATDGGPNHFQPQIAADRAGNWIAVWQYRDINDTFFDNDSSIKTALSVDNALSWGAETTLYNNSASNSGLNDDARLAADGQGKWICLWDSNDSLGGTINTDHDILFATTTVSPVLTYADLGITMTDSADPISTGTPLIYTINIRNHGVSTATNATVTDQLPAGTIFLNCSVPGAVYDSVNHQVIVPLGVIAAGTISSFTIQIQPPDHAAILTNTASVTSDTPDLDTNNNSASETTTATEPFGPDFVVNWTTLKKRVSGRGSRVRYRIQGRLSLSNIGDRDAANGVQLGFYLSPDPVNDVDGTALRVLNVRKLKRGRTVTKNIAVFVTQDPTGKNLVAVADPGNAVAELNESNNRADIGPIP